MPTYEYECRECGHRFEVFQKISDDPISACEKCGKEVRKVLFPVGIMFKGSGFHVNDYRKKGTGNREQGTEEKVTGNTEQVTDSKEHSTAKREQADAKP